MKKCDVALINPLYKYPVNYWLEKYYIRSGSRWPHSGVKIKGRKPHYLPFPFFLAYTAGLLQKYGYTVESLDAVALDIGEKELLEWLQKVSPDILLFETTTPTINYDLSLVVAIKRLLPKTIICVAGAHASVFGREILKENCSIDYIVVGEIEKTFLFLVEYIKKRKKEIPKGIFYRDKENIIFSGEPLIEKDIDLKYLRYCARDIFPSRQYKYPQIYWDGFCQNWPAIQIQTSRGCPYHCPFCLWNEIIYRKGPYRIFPFEQVKEEIEQAVYQFGAKEIYIDDDDFFINKEHIKKVASLLKQFKRRKVYWSCMADAVNWDEQLISYIADCGCIGIKFGVETVSERFKKYVPKPVSLEKVKKLIFLCRKFKIKTHATFMIGFPGETELEMKRTINFAQSLAVDSLQISIVTPFPGTSLWQEIGKKEDCLIYNWSCFDGKVGQMLKNTDIDWQKVLNIKKEGMKKWIFSKLSSPANCVYTFNLILRSLKGMGIKNFSSKLFSTFIDEYNNH